MCAGLLVGQAVMIERSVVGIWASSSNQQLSLPLFSLLNALRQFPCCVARRAGSALVVSLRAISILLPQARVLVLLRGFSYEGRTSMLYHSCVLAWDGELGVSLGGEVYLWVFFQLWKGASPLSSIRGTLICNSIQTILCLLSIRIFLPIANLRNCMFLCPLDSRSIGDAPVYNK
ncbi:hypothetical protein SCHPADRAFT_72215 [Schizopora paradoxa]|uniref:Uncharacterized protein n=1 Tax=Schizopora paradoxa TaxID=27342 RepID=A0A0H2SQH7_9AGAM|nr:hypothetical protein SCHPADRAFT_72215 [Schizopora paradoxa]